MKIDKVNILLSIGQNVDVAEGNSQVVFISIVTVAVR